MSKRLDQLTQLTASQLAQDDIIGIRDQSAGQTKYITVKDLTGAPEFGWQATGESHVFSSWNATTRIGVITIPSDGTTKYTPGQRYRCNQTTGGLKYGIIHAVTATTLTVFFASGYTLNNEAITSPVYSPLDSPVGFDKTPDNWTLTYRKTTRTTQVGASLSTWYNLGGSLAVGPGSWLLSALDQGLQTNVSATYMGFVSALATAASGSPLADSRVKSTVSSTATTEIDDMYKIDNIPFTTAAAATIYLLRGTGTGSAVALYSEQTTDTFSNANHYIKALSAYL
jgi:hypothetical protein